MGHTGMYVLRAALVFLIACHSSSPSVSRGSATAESTTAATPTVPAQQNEAPTAGNHPLEPTSGAAPTGSGAASGATGQGATPTGGSAASGPGIGEACGPDDRCAAGLTCLAYYGFAGPRGPQFKTCEIRCKDSATCPKGTVCVTVSDGPGQVCRN